MLTRMLTRMLTCAVIFLAELSFKLLAMGPTRLFMDGRRYYWNYFDFVVVALGACPHFTTDFTRFTSTKVHALTLSLRLARVAASVFALLTYATLTYADVC